MTPPQTPWTKAGNALLSQSRPNSRKRVYVSLARIVAIEEEAVSEYREALQAMVDTFPSLGPWTSNYEEAGVALRAASKLLKEGADQVAAAEPGR